VSAEPRWLRVALFALALALLLQGAYHWWPRTVDDAFITFHYAQNLADGHGAVFNPGERVEGYSSPSWMIGSATVVALGLDPVTAAKWAGLLAAVCLLFVLYRGLDATGVAGWGAGAATLLAGSSFVLWTWSVSGMETTAYALLFFSGLMLLAHDRASNANSALASIVLGAAALTRPEGLAFWVLGLAVQPFTGSRESRLRRTAAYAMPGLALLAHFAWRLAYYGSLLPNTYYAKTGGGLRMWRQGLDGLSGFVAEPAHLAWLAAAAAGLVVGIVRPATRRAVTIVALATLGHLAYVVSVGDDGLFVHRFYVPVLAPLAWLAGQLLRRDESGSTRTRALATIGVVAIAVTVPLSAWKFHSTMVPALTGVAAPYLEGNVKLGRHLAETRPASTVIAVASAGAIPYYSRLQTIDMYGLNDPRIARGPFPEGVRGRIMKWDNAYVLSRRPDLIVINRGYFRADDPWAEQAARDPAPLLAAPMDRDLFEHLRIDGSYAPRIIRFDDGSVFYVFERIAAAP